MKKIEKRIAAVLLCAVIVFTTIVNAYAFDEKGENNGLERNWSYSQKEDGTIEINEYLGEESFIQIPSEINGKEVSSLADCLFQNKDVENVVIPYTVKTIGKYAFKNCKKLKSIDLGRVEEIGSYCFINAESLEKITLPETLNLIGTDAFYKCLSLENIVYKCADAEQSSNYGTCFQSCKKLKSINIASTVRSIPKKLFAKTTTEKVIVEGEDLNFGKMAFSECENLREVYFGGNRYSFTDEKVFFGSPNIELYVNSNSDILCYAIKNDLLYTAVDSDNVDGCLDSSISKYEVSSFSRVSKYVKLNVEYSLKDSYNIKDGTVLNVYLGEKTKLAQEKPILLDGKVITSYTYKDGELNIPIKSSSGMAQILINTSEIKKQQSTYARIVSQDYNGVIGSVVIGKDALTLLADSKTSKSNISVKGIAPSGTTVRIYDGDTKLADLNTSKIGYYEGKVDLCMKEGETEHTLKAEVICDGEEYTKSMNVTYEQNCPELTQFDFIYYTIHTGYRKVDLLNCGDNAMVYLAPSHGYKFCVNFDSRDKIDRVFVTSKKNGGIDDIELFWDEKLGCYYSESNFINVSSSVPGDLSVFYTNKTERRQYDVSTEEKLESTISELTVSEKSLPESFNGAIIETLENTSKRYSSVIKSSDGRAMDICVTKIDCNKTEQEDEKEPLLTLDNLKIWDKKALKEKILSDGFKVADEMYCADFVGGDTVKFCLLDISKEKIFVYTIDKMSEFTGIGFNDAYSFFSDLKEGKYDKCCKAFIQKKTILGENGTTALWDFGGLYFDYLSEYKSVFYSNMSEEEKSARYAEMDKCFKKQVLSIEVNFIASFTKKMGTEMVMGGNPWGLALFAASVVAEDFFSWYANKYDGEGFIFGEYLEFKEKQLKYIIDPSGVVYEGVTTNYLDGVTATIYYKNDKGEEILWDAQEYLQKNPIITECNGAYAWDVPEGTWRVKFEKDDYLTTYSQWMDVPPEQTDVNIDMVSTKLPVVSCSKMRQDYIVLYFSQYMNPQTVGKIKIKDEKGNLIKYTLSYPEIEKNSEGKILAKEFTLRFDNYKAQKNEIYNLDIPQGVENYCGNTVNEQVLEVKAELSATIRTISSIEVSVGDTVDIPVQIDQFKGNEKIVCINENECMVRTSISEPSQDGQAVLHVTGITKGVCNVTVKLDDNSESFDIKVVIGEVSQSDIVLPEYIEKWEDEDKPVIKRIKKVILSSSSYTYTGKVIKPSVKVIDSDGKVVSKSGYKVTYSSGCKNVGIYKVTVNSLGNYSGVKTVKFMINPKPTNISKVNTKKGQINVSFKKCKTQTTGYQIEWSTKSNFKTSKTKTYSNNVTSVSLKRLKSKKNYYIRVRTYKVMENKKYYSKWSNVKKAKTK